MGIMDFHSESYALDLWIRKNLESLRKSAVFILYSRLENKF